MRLSVLVIMALFYGTSYAYQNGYGAPVNSNPYLLQEYQNTYIQPQAPQGGYGGVAPGYGQQQPQPPSSYYPSQPPQYPTQPAPSYPTRPYNDPVGELNYYGNLCDESNAPHSYACHHWNYLGNSRFPLFRMDWWSLQGEWFATTYANPQSENVGPEFQMLKNPRRPTQPMGVIDNFSGQQVGSVWLTANAMVWTNWLGQVLETDPSTFRQLDANTVEMYAFGYQQSHYFQCRDFNRNNGHHLLCRWDVLDTRTQSWTPQGYFGFILKSQWDSFVNSVRN